MKKIQKDFDNATKHELFSYKNEALTTISNTAMQEHTMISPKYVLKYDIFYKIFITYHWKPLRHMEQMFDLDCSVNLQSFYNWQCSIHRFWD